MPAAWVTCVGKSGSVTNNFAKQSRNLAKPTSPRSRRCAFFFASEVIGYLCARRLASRHPGRTHSPAWSARKYAKGFGTPHTSITLPAGWRRRSYAASVAACASASVSALPEFGVPQTWRNHIRFSPAGSRVRCSAGSLRVATPPARLEPLTMLGS